MQRFSKKHGFDQRAGQVRVRWEAPSELRAAVVEIAGEAGALHLGRTVCRALRVRTDGQHYSANDIVELLDTREWFEVYDVIEAIAADLNEMDARYQTNAAGVFQDEINDYFERSGTGWVLQSGKLQARADADFESALRSCELTLTAAALSTARGEIREARQDLSRRPSPDITGAIQHAIAGLECVLREVTGSKTATLGALVASSRDRFPAPLDQALEKLWGFASERGRHLRESRNPSVTEAELVVHVAAALIAYLLDQHAAELHLQDGAV
jgi:hypothetical protein